MERSLTQYGRGVNLGFAKSEGNFPFSLSLSLCFSLVIAKAERRGKLETIFRRAKGFLCVFSSVKVILGGRIPLTVDRPTSKAVHRCTCGFRVD